MRLLADVHISPRSVIFLRGLGHDVLRVGDVLPANAADSEIVAFAERESRCVLTQDLDFSAIIALAGGKSPSLISLRLSSSRVDLVNSVLARVLPAVEDQVIQGSIVTVEDQRIRVRSLPITS
jgi:predicted nuclease of predicted toxin-antitoxin system